MAKNPREIAMNILVDINENKAYSNIILNKYLERDIDLGMKFHKGNSIWSIGK